MQPIGGCTILHVGSSAPVRPQDAAIKNQRRFHNCFTNPGRKIEKSAEKEKQEGETIEISQNFSGLAPFCPHFCITHAMACQQKQWSTNAAIAIKEYFNSNEIACRCVNRQIMHWHTVANWCLVNSTLRKFSSRFIDECLWPVASACVTSCSNL